MKWHKFDSRFWDSKTADILESYLGEKGLVAYLRMVSRIALELQTYDEVLHAIEHGWEKNLQDWCRILKFSPHFVRKLLKILVETEILTCSFFEINGRIRIKVKLYNIHEFVHRDAFSSEERDKIKLLSGRPESRPEGRPAGALEKNRVEKNRSAAATPEVFEEVEKTSIPIERFLELWNLHHPSKVRGLYPRRLDLALKAWKEKPDWDYWVDVFKKAASSDFLNHKKLGARVNLDWCFEHHIEISEGKYANASSGGENYVAGLGGQLR